MRHLKKIFEAESKKFSVKKWISETMEDNDLMQGYTIDHLVRCYEDLKDVDLKIVLEGIRNFKPKSSEDAAAQAAIIWDLEYYIKHPKEFLDIIA